MKAEIENLPHSAYFIDELRGGGRDAIITAPTQLLKMHLIFTPPPPISGLILSYQTTSQQEVAKKHIIVNTPNAENASIIEMLSHVLCFRKTS
jgi:hypothetical protein